MSRTLKRVVPPDFLNSIQALMRHVTYDTTPTELYGWLGRVVTHQQLYRFTLVIATMAPVCYDSHC
jgi:hypothetical protein